MKKYLVVYGNPALLQACDFVIDAGKCSAKIGEVQVVEGSLNDSVAKICYDKYQTDPDTAFVVPGNVAIPMYEARRIYYHLFGGARLNYPIDPEFRTELVNNLEAHGVKVSEIPATMTERISAVKTCMTNLSSSEEFGTLIYMSLKGVQFDNADGLFDKDNLNAVSQKLLQIVEKIAENTALEELVFEV